jgi:replication factor C subunit 3/5
MDSIMDNTIDKETDPSIATFAEGDVEMDILPWIEKYRPKTLDDIVSHKDIVTSMENFIKDESMPHVLFFGPPGTGKTSITEAIKNKLYGVDQETMVLELNASEERGIDIVRGRIKKFVSSTIAFTVNKNYKFKLVILDEIDSMTDDAQWILRKIIEENTKHARFFLICNYINKITPELRSRCLCFKFTPLPRNRIKKRMRYIITKEGLDISDDVIDTIIDRSNGDMRKVLNILQSTSIMTDKITPDIVNNCVGYPLSCQVKYIINALIENKENKENKDRSIICNDLIEYIWSNSLSLSDILIEIHRYLLNNIDRYDTDKLIELFDNLKQIDINISFNTNSKLDIITICYAFSLLD